METKHFETFINKNEEKINAIAERLSTFRIDSIPIGFENAKSRTIKWLMNFSAIGLSLQKLKQVLLLLEKMDYIGSDDIAKRLARISEPLLKDKSVSIAPLGEDSESSFRISANFNQHPRYYTSLEKLLDNIPGEGSNQIILFDDFLNSGGQIITIFKTLLGIPFADNEINDEGDHRATLNENHKKKLLNAKIHIFYHTAFDKGIKYSDEKNDRQLGLDITFHRYSSADDTDGIFGDREDHLRIENKLLQRISSGLFKNNKPEELFSLYRILKEAGYELLKVNEPHWSDDKRKNRSLGYGNEARITITDFNVPTNTITALWMSGKIFLNGKSIEWEGLLPRRKKILSEKIDSSVTMEGSTKQNSVTGEFVNGRDYLEEFNREYIEKHFINNNLNYDFRDSRLITHYNKLFSNIGNFSSKPFPELHSDNIFQYILNVCSNPEQFTILITGLSGCGKSMFISVLYKFLYNKFISGEFNNIPLYINLDHFVKSVYPESNPDFQSKAEQEIKAIAYKTRDIQKQFPDKKLLILIDGVDQHKNRKVNISAKVYDYINKYSVSSITCVRKIDESRERGDTEVLPITFGEKTFIELDLTNIPVEQTEKLAATIQEYASIRFLKYPEKISGLFDSVSERIKKYNLEKIDLFILEILSESYNNFNYNGKADNLSGFLSIYFQGQKIDVNKAGRIALRISDPSSIPESNEINCKEWWYIHKHPVFKDYFMAKYVIDELINPQNNNLNKDIFNHVYPYTHNIFFKEIINASSTTQKAVLENIKNIIPLLVKGVHTHAKTHLCYLLGRLDGGAYKDEAKTHLHDLLKKGTFKNIQSKIQKGGTQALTGDQKKELLLLRTIYISLIYLGDTDTSNNFIEQLRANKYLCNLNRGFHLEYYGDIKFDFYSQDSLKHEDNHGDYCQTFNKLFDKIQTGVRKKSKYPMFEIELYTLLSLAQHRQVENTMIKGEAEKRSKIVGLLTLLQERVFNISTPLMEYIEFVKEILERQDLVSDAHLVGEIISKIKKTERIGWVTSKVPTPESVADHIYGTYLLAFHFLPDNEDDIGTGYKKDTVLKMLLHHDLPEWKYGDIDGSKKTDDEKIREEKVAKKMSLLSTYKDIANVSGTGKYYSEFSRGSDINAQIAKDIDRLEMLLQLANYKNDGSLSDLPDEAFLDLKNYSQKVSTHIGLKIREKILRLFE